MQVAYIFGHKMPDTDSVCASISLSYLKNKLGLRTEPRVLGGLNKETKFVLDYFSTKIRLYFFNYQGMPSIFWFTHGNFMYKNRRCKPVCRYKNAAFGLQTGGMMRMLKQTMTMNLLKYARWWL
jgi:hypothetical protein